MTRIKPWMCAEGAQVQLRRERCVPKVLKLSSEVSECKALICGVIHYNDAKIQLLDLPGIIEGASEGKGRAGQYFTFRMTQAIKLSPCRRTSQFSRVPQMAVATSREVDGRVAILCRCMANLTVYLLKVAKFAHH